MGTKRGWGEGKVMEWGRKGQGLVTYCRSTAAYL